MYTLFQFVEITCSTHATSTVCLTVFIVDDYFDCSC